MILIICLITLFLNAYESESRLIAQFRQRTNLNMLINRPLSPQPTWGLINKKPDVTILDVVSVLGRFRNRTDFCEGQGYMSPENGKLLTSKIFYEKLCNRNFDAWPMDSNGQLIGLEGLDNDAIERAQKGVRESLSEGGVDAVFTTFSRGATNGVTYPAQVDEEMAKWRDENGVFNIRKFEEALFIGRFNVLLGWFLYIGLQFGGIYVVFFAPIMQYYFPGVDFYPVLTYLHTSEWGK